MGKEKIRENIMVLRYVFEKIDEHKDPRLKKTQRENPEVYGYSGLQMTDQLLNMLDDLGKDNPNKKD